MSRKSWGRGLLDILRQLGARIDKKAEDAVAHERELTPEASTEDIVRHLSLAPPEIVAQAVEIARAEGSSELLQDQYVKAQAQARETRLASAALGSVAAGIAAKK